MTDHDLAQFRAAVEGALAPLESRLAGIEGRVDNLSEESRAARDAMDTNVRAVKDKIDSRPDLHILQAASQRQLAEVREARRYVEIKLDEIHGSIATSSTPHCP